MTPKQMEQDFIFLRGQVQRLSRLIDALESSSLLIAAVSEPAPENAPAIRPIADLEREAILAARRSFGVNSRAACGALGVARTTYYRRLKEYGVSE